MADEGAALGVATTRVEERLLASLGKLQAAPIRFEAVADVPKGGVLCALPALLGLGLLRHSREHFALPPGYYPLETMFLSVAFLALARVPPWKPCVMSRLGNGASSWGWIACRKCARCGPN